ncbi:MAG TPA: hypothetical protein VF059_13945 [Casimicrobiaceae bacterium]
MTFPVNQDARYFSVAGYEAMLVRALGLGYRVVPFREFAPPAERPVLLLRHDLDGPLGGAQVMAEVEAKSGVRATYFVQVACDFYNLLAADGRAFLRRLASLGHEVGLHYEASRYRGDIGAIASDLRLLEDLSGQPVRSASQHIPVDNDPVAIDAYVDNEAYEPRFTQAPMTYISDSLMAWRQATPHDLLDRGASFQLLTHPETWRGGYASMAEALDGMMAEETEAIARRYRSLAAYYAELLGRRAERDHAFRAARLRPPG